MRKINVLACACALMASSLSFSEDFGDFHTIQLQLIEANDNKVNALIQFSGDHPVSASQWVSIGVAEPKGAGVTVKDYRNGYQVVVKPGSLANTIDIDIESTHIIDMKKIKIPGDLSADVPVVKDCSMKYRLNIDQAYSNMNSQNPCSLSVVWL